MTRVYSWRLEVRNYESDAWGQVPASVILRYLEQTAVAAAANAGYDNRFHQERQSAWVIRRMALLMHEPAHPGDQLEITTWISNFARIRGGREYRVEHAATGQPVATGLAEWVYINRSTLVPLPIPREVIPVFDPPGAPLGNYDPPPVPASEEQPQFTMERVAEWHEADSMVHVNNANYADWLDDAVRTALDEQGWSVPELRARGLALRGGYYNLSYKQAVVPGDHLTLTTRFQGSWGRLCGVQQGIARDDGTEVLEARSVYGWRTLAGEEAEPPEGWSTCEH